MAAIHGHPIFRTPYQWSLAGLNGFKKPLPASYTQRIIVVFQRAIGWMLGLCTLPFTWSWYKLGDLFTVSKRSSISSLDGPGARATITAASKQSMQHLANALMPNEDIICSDISLSRYFSQLPLDLSGKKIVIFCKDAGGFGDFMFGLKVLEILHQRFPEAILTLASDSPQKALKLNDKPYIQILMHQDPTLSLEQVAGLIHDFSCDFFIIGPVTWMHHAAFNTLTDSRPSLSIREYGFTTLPLRSNNETDYISGPAKPYVGMLVHEPLMKWADQKEDRLACLQHLKDLPHEVSHAILGQDFSESAIQKFAQNSLLFGCYSAKVNTKIRFILSIATAFHKHLNVDQELCFFIFGSRPPEFLQLIEQYQAIFQDLKINSFELVDLNVMPHSTYKYTINPSSPRKIRCIFSSLQPRDTAIIIQASEKEILTTGDQSWSEGVSAKKRWIQERLVHKAATLVKVLELSAKLAEEKKGAFIQLNGLLQEIYGKRRPYEEPANDRYEEYARLLSESRNNPELGQAWETLNEHLVENNIRDWLIGKIVWKVLEKAYPEDLSQLQSLIGKEIKGEQLQHFFQTLASR